MRVTMWAALVPALFGFAGCKSSTRDMLVGETVSLEIGQPAQLQPPGSFPLAASADGRWVAHLVIDGDVKQVEVRDGATAEVIRVWRDMPGLPVVISPSGTVFSKEGDRLFVSDVAGDSWKFYAEVPDTFWFHAARSSDGRLLWLADRWLMNDRGLLIEVPDADVRFDANGSAWFSARGWKEVTSDGRIHSRSSRPARLYFDGAHCRNTMWLEAVEAEQKHQGATAYLTTVWLRDERAFGDARAAVVFSGSDIVWYGFVPSRDEVCIVTHHGGYFVPFEEVYREPDRD